MLGAEYLTMNTPLKEIRVRRGLTLDAVSRSVDTDTGNLSRIENGKQGASVQLAERLSKFYAGEISELAILYPDRFRTAHEDAA